MHAAKITSEKLINLIESAWDMRDTLKQIPHAELREAIQVTLAGIETGFYRVCEKTNDGWHVNQWIKKAVVLSFL